MDCTLDLYTNYLLSVPGKATATGLSRLVDYRVSHDQVTRFLASSYFDSRTIWQHAKPLVRQCNAGEETGVLILDDSIAEKAHTDENAIISWYWDHSQHRYVKGMNFLTLFYHMGQLNVPLGVTLIEKTVPYVEAKSGQTKYKSEHTKNEYACQMLQIAKEQVTFNYVLADSWFSSADNLQYITTQVGKHAIMGLECSRTVAVSETDRLNGHFQRIDALETLKEGVALRVYIRSLAQPVLVVKQVFTNKDGSTGTLFLIATDTTLTYDQIVEIYKKRWKVEEYHKSLKQHTALTESPTKTIATQANHFFAAVLAYIKLETLKLQLGQGHFKIKSILWLAAAKAALVQLNLWAA